MRKQIKEMRVGNIDVENATLAKRQRWAELQAKDVEKIYADIQSKLKQIPKDQWTAWDVESLNRIEAILGDRRADEIRNDIERIMTLAGLSYGLERASHYKKHEMLKKLRDEGEET
ncbi:MAG: hypothetical protein ISP40_08715 [Alphaproteobacteria bacterium]|nr:hypothetical protein [Alphaproteobacteria bacterium]